MPKPSILRTNDVMKDVCALLDLPHTRVHRLVLELTAGEPVIVGIEMMPDKTSDVVAVFATAVKRHHVAEDGGLVEASE